MFVKKIRVKDKYTTFEIIFTFTEPTILEVKLNHKSVLCIDFYNILKQDAFIPFFGQCQRLHSIFRESCEINYPVMHQTCFLYHFQSLASHVTTTRVQTIPRNNTAMWNEKCNLIPRSDLDKYLFSSNLSGPLSSGHVWHFSARYRNLSAFTVQCQIIVKKQCLRLL